MKLSDDFEDKGSQLPVVYAAIGVMLFVLTVLGVVAVTNKTSAKNAAENKREAEQTNESARAQEEENAVSTGQTDPYLSGSTLRSEDLDFWHMYDKTERPAAEEKKEEEKEETQETEDVSTDGRHTKLVSADGTEEWVSINPYLTKNTYDYSGLVYQYPIMKYYENSEKVSKVGIKVSADDGEIDFKRLKKAGVDFAMIRLGSRGYGSGNIMADEMFYENVKKASEAGMDIGVTFFSQAITKEEAQEEAMRVIEGLQGFTIVYPVAFDMEYVSNDAARVQSLSKAAKTEIAAEFMDTIRQAGYKTILYGDKEWLLRRVDLTKLIAYDIWFSQEQDVPDYPYKYTMWEYTRSAKLSGLSESADLTICFVDYASK